MSILINRHKRSSSNSIQIIINGFFIVILFFNISNALGNWEDKPWFKHYPKSVQTTLSQTPDIKNYLQQKNKQSILDIWQQVWEKDSTSRRVALTGFKHELTYRQVNQQSQHLAAYLKNYNSDSTSPLNVNQRVAIMMPSSPEMVVAFLGVIRAEMTPVIVLAAGDTEELGSRLADQLQLCKPSYLIGMKTHSKAIDNALGRIQKSNDFDPAAIHIILSDLFDTAEEVSYCTRLYHIVISTIAQCANRTQNLTRAHTPLRQALDTGSGLEFTDPILDSESTAFLQFTSGTTGKPKAIEITHGNMIANITQIADQAREKVKINPTVFQPLPLTHAFGLMITVGFTPLLEGQTILVIDPRNKDRLLEALDSRPDVMFGVDKLFKVLMNPNGPYQTVLNDHFTSSPPTLVFAGASSINRDTRQQTHNMTRQRITEGYGMSESTVGIAIEPMQTEPENWEAVGMAPLPWVDIAILKIPEEGIQKDFSPDKLTLADGDEGELFVSGPNVAKGYFENTEATEETFITDTQGVRWLRTGDRAKINKNGLLEITGREKEIIIVGGQNVNPSKIETEALEIENVNEVIIFGIPKDLSSQAGEERVVLVAKGVANKESISYKLTQNPRLEKHEKPITQMVFCFTDIHIPRTAGLEKPKRVEVKRKVIEGLKTNFSHNNQPTDQDVSDYLEANLVEIMQSI